MRTTIWTHVDVDVCELLDGMPVDELRAYLARRTGDETRKAADEAANDFAAEVEDLLRAGRFFEAMLLVERWQRPKFRSEIWCRLGLDLHRSGVKGRVEEAVVARERNAMAAELRT